MKTLKLSRKVQIILATIFIFIVGAIIASIMANNKVSAATRPCGDPNCSGTMTCRKYETGLHRWHCNICSYIQQEACSGGSWTHKEGTSVHQKFCWACGWFYAQEDCYDDDGDGECDEGCGNSDMHRHSYTDIYYTKRDDETHNVIKECSCGDTQNAGVEEHNFGSYVDNGGGNHSATCSDCGYKKTESHRGATHANGGKCTVCKAVYETHKQSSTIKEYTKTEAGHTPIYKCTHQGCAETFQGQEEQHKGATHANGGKCTVCDKVYETHGQSNIIKEYTKTQTGHTPVYKCTQEGCTQTYNGQEEQHKGATHENGGICTTCRQQYETHEQSSTIKEYIKTETGHTPIYICTHEGCTERFQGQEEQHTGATHENGGVCTTCGQKYETHEQSSTIKEYTKTEAGHTPIYKCTHEECTETFQGQEEQHTGATHENGGVCTTCGQQYETHEQSDIIKEYIKTDTTHTPVYECTHEGCTETFQGQEEQHIGATHENGGICITCGQQYETHEQSDIIKEYIKTDTTHTPIYKCTHEGCTETYIGQEEPHKNETYTDNGDGTHSSTCTECGEVTTENHNFENGTCTDCESEEPDVDIDSDEYEFLEGYVTNIQPHTMASTFKQNLKTNATEINIYNNENKLLKDDEIVATKMKLELKKGSKVKTFTLVVRGDVNEDGEADFKDMTKINQVRLNKETLDKAYSIAADVTDDNKIEFKDLVKINRFRLNKIREL